ncbi:hypothetical protein GH741_06895 [Aquibacillus halophilus]|uniref:Uncharacterized protein n=1 Tax=Aquibacillus halophilus TaxID=930132 RepID=A0A6A8DEY3_9BACI|nr:hypothetical protein [Aquibacillus halophilus]MRH42409.1 hypothetical protein [Aquibacillus halophilus]
MGVYYFRSDYVFEEDKWISKSIQVENERIVITQINKQRTIEMNVDKFWIGPGKVYIDYEEPLYDRKFVDNTVNKYIYRGCTLLICQLPIRSYIHFKRKFEQFREHLSSLPIDYMIVPRIPTHLLQPDIIKFFGTKKMPFVLIDTNSKHELLKVKWEWLESAQYFSGIPFVLHKDGSKNKRKELTSTWSSICKKYRINTIEENISEYPLSKETLRQTGISPFKGEFLHQSSADYNLFEMDEIPSVDERPKFRYHKAIPVVTVSKGEVIKYNHLIHPEKAKGELKQVSIPNHFIST